MLTSHTRFAAAGMLIFLWAATVSAQQTDTGGDTAAQGTAGGAGGDGPNVLSADAESEFTAVERGDTVGATGDTGAGFSALSVAAPGGGGAGGRAGGIGGGGGGLGGFGALGNLFGGGFGGGTSQTSKPIIRTRLRAAISGPPTPPALVQQSASMRFRSLPNRPQLRGINVAMQGRTAVISGVVRSEGDRRMSELLMRLEPGVSSVDNRVVVMPQ